MANDWTLLKVVVDGERLEINGVNVWDHHWTDTGQTVKVKDPLYGKEHTLSTYRVDADDKTIIFSATEFSNCVWGFYCKS